MQLYIFLLLTAKRAFMLALTAISIHVISRSPSFSIIAVGNILLLIIIIIIDRILSIVLILLLVVVVLLLFLQCQWLWLLTLSS